MGSRRVSTSFGSAGGVGGRVRIAALWLCACSVGCGEVVTREVETHYADPVPAKLTDARWVYQGGRCAGSKRDISLAALQGEMRVAQRGRELRLMWDRTLAGGCEQTVAMTASPVRDQRYLLQEQARSATHAQEGEPPDAQCLGQPEPSRTVQLAMHERRLDFTLPRARLCEGYDAVLQFEAAAPQPLGDRSLVRHFVAHFNRQDASSLAALFTERGRLLAPFETDGLGMPVSHQGREAVEAWLRRHVGTRPWVAMRLGALHRGPGGALSAQWQYLDPALEQPLDGGTQFVLGGGELFEVRLWLQRGAGSEGGAPPAEPYGPATAAPPSQPQVETPKGPPQAASPSGPPKG